jgi:hypothetical protein
VYATPDHTLQLFPSSPQHLNQACQNPGEEPHMANPGDPDEPEGDYNTRHHSTPRVEGHDSKYRCKSGNLV